MYVHDADFLAALHLFDVKPLLLNSWLSETGGWNTDSRRISRPLGFNASQRKFRRLDIAPPVKCARPTMPHSHHIKKRTKGEIKARGRSLKHFDCGTAVAIPPNHLGELMEFVRRSWERWVFGSENQDKPIWKDNLWHLHMKPRHGDDPAKPDYSRCCAARTPAWGTRHGSIRKFPPTSAGTVSAYGRGTFRHAGSTRGSSILKPFGKIDFDEALNRSRFGVWSISNDKRARFRHPN